MFKNVYLRAVVWFEMAVAVLAARLRPRTALAGARGVTFIEYALLAAIAVVVAAIFRSQLTSTFSTLLAKFHLAATT